MHKGFYVLPLTAVSFLILLSLAAPSSAAMWLASTSVGYIIIRFIMAVALVGLIVTNPPRKVWFRALLGIISGGLAIWAVVGLYTRSIMLVDFLIFMQVSIAFALSALERTPEEVMAETNRLLEVGRVALKNH